MGVRTVACGPLPTERPPDGPGIAHTALSALVATLGLMQTGEFYEEQSVSTPDPRGGFATSRIPLRTDLLSTLRAGAIPGDDDLETALALTRMVHGELEAYGTGGGEQMSEEQIELAQRCLRAVLDRQMHHAALAVAELRGLPRLLAAKRRLRLVAGKARPARHVLQTRARGVGPA